MSALPIDPLLPEIVARLARGTRLVLRAPPGAGKTTRVPGALLDAGLAGDGEIVVLEPRRIAARAAAEYVARERGGALGAEVGYRVRFEQCGGAGTRIWFVTAGVFSRMLARDPFLERATIVVLDEFHERSLDVDVALAVVRELQATVRPDLRLVVMSATLETEKLAAALGDCAVVTSEGRAHPIDIEHDESDARAPLHARVAATVRRTLERDKDRHGDSLVFLPGAGEIRRTATALEPLLATFDLDVVALHGNLPLDAQQRALRAGPRRRVILSTNVAETALTVEGVTTVIDSGLARTARLDTRHGINSLRLTRISQAAAGQRAGRAGRLGPGRCIRLWSRADHVGRRPFETPEILRLDLTAMVLELRGWGLRDAAGLMWLDPPPASNLAAAERLLIQLGAVDEAQRALTEIGHRMLALPAPPRVARLLVEAERTDIGADGALLAALISERDVLAETRQLDAGPAGRWPAGPSDVILRLDLVRHALARNQAPHALRAGGLDPGAVHAVERARRQLARLLGRKERQPRRDAATNGATQRSTHNDRRRGTAGGTAPATLGSPVGSAAQGRIENTKPAAQRKDEALTAGNSTAAPGREPRRATGSDAQGKPPSGHAAVANRDLLLRATLAAFPDRVARRQTPGSARATMVGGRVVALAAASVVRDAELFVAVDVELGSGAGAREAIVRAASEIRREWLAEVFPAAVADTVDLAFEAERERVVERRRSCYHDLVLDERLNFDVDPAAAGELLAEEARKHPERAVHLGPPERELLARIEFLRGSMPERDLPASDALLADAVAALCTGRRSFGETRAQDVTGALRGLLGAARLATLDRDAPGQLLLPSGRRAPVVYDAGKPPTVAARIQELFGLTATPRLAGGRVALVLSILAPNQRPVQITDDLESFWRRTYPEVARQLRRRYPKHAWPDDPLTAKPTAGPRRR